MLNRERTRELLQSFNFDDLFIDELGWNNPTIRTAFSIPLDEGTYSYKAIAELASAKVFEVTSPDGKIPNAKTRNNISEDVERLHQEHILIFKDANNSQTLWRWIKRQDNKKFPREHQFFKGQTGDSFIAKLAGLFVDISEIEENITISDVAKKMQKALDIERVTKKFYSEYQDQFVSFLELIQGIPNEADKRWYASVILNRLMFIYFLQKKAFLDRGNMQYLNQKLLQYPTDGVEFYGVFLQKLFFEGFAKTEEQRSEETKALIGDIRYLNGGLFLHHKIEQKYHHIVIPNQAFHNLFRLFDSYSWSLDDTPGGRDNEINPNVLGYIFEKYINQKAFGAYYTRPEITEYLCEQTVYKLILDAINEPDVDMAHIEQAKLGGNPRRFDNVPDLLFNLDTQDIKKLVIDKQAILPNLSLLDPACGSGAFLVAAMKVLIEVYGAIWGKIEISNDPDLVKWKRKIEEEHPSIQYYIKKQIITHNLYGVDVMEEATEIAKLRLFLALVASAMNVNQLEPLPNIDFNIMAGNSLIGLMRVDENQFNKHFNAPQILKGKVVQEQTLFKQGVVQGNIFAEEHSKSYQQLINEKEVAVRSYKNAHHQGIDGLEDLRDSIEKMKRDADKTLNKLLLEEFTTLGIRYEEATWDETKQKLGKPRKRNLTPKDIETLEPFHWGYAFSEIFRKKNGFDAIITNPPWEIFKPQAKEFFAEFSEVVTKNKMNIKDFEKKQNELIQNEEIRTAWLQYQSRYPHLSLYFRSAQQYKNQISVVNGRKQGTDINLYKLFTEQCHNLLKEKGYCGIVIPSGIYTDLGAKQLREMLFDQAQITGLFCFENRKEIFEGVHRSFKFVVLSFEKGGKTTAFPAAFMRHDTSELHDFPKQGAVSLSLDFIRKQSPDSLSIMEMKNDLEFTIVDKMLQFPLLGEKVEGSWDIKLGTEFHMTNDSYLFRTTPQKGTLPLYEGKMIHQFTHQWNNVAAKYWIDEQEGRKALLGRTEDTGQILDYQRYRLGFRDIAASTNERSAIFLVVPSNVFVGNTLPFVSASIFYDQWLCILSFCNSLVFDYSIRQRITNHLNFHFVYNTPVPRINAGHPYYRALIIRAARLVCTTPEFAELWEEVMETRWEASLSAREADDRNQLRAELDGMVAHLYGLTEDELVYILGTFPLVPQAQKDLVLEAFRKTTPLSAYNEQVQALLAQGECPTIEFKSTLRVDVRTKKNEKHIEHSVLKTLAAFLNSEGGTLLIGVEDNKNVIGLDLDFASFSKPDKLDEFQKHFDNLIQKYLGDRFHRYLKVSFPSYEGKTICLVEVLTKSERPVYMKDENNREMFYIRRLASTKDLPLSEATQYITEHWPNV